MNKIAPVLIIYALLVGACGEAENPNRVVGELTSDRIELTAESNEPITAIRFAEGDLRSKGRGTQGVRGIKLREGDGVVAAVSNVEGEEVLLRARPGGEGGGSVYQAYIGSPVIPFRTHKPDDADGQGLRSALVEAGQVELLVP